MSFKNQIIEDINGYKERFSHIQQIHNDEWAFNFWILDKFFNEDEELIVDKIIEDRDRGIDVYQYYEDTNELFLVQNKFYSDNSYLQTEYVINNLFINPVTILDEGTYTRCPELQAIYNEGKNRANFTIYFHVYVTNDRINSQVEEAVREYNARNNPRIFFKVFYLKDIKKKYFGEIPRSRTTIDVMVESINNDTILNIDRNKFRLNVGLDAKYILTPITCIYRIYKETEENDYELFEMNIRDYLGNKGINAKIFGTLKDEEDRKNFFYYNNGITMICDSFSNEEVADQEPPSRFGSIVKVSNPQIVNGCQTVTSIYEALRNMDQDSLEEEFKDTYVMLKLLQIERQDVDTERQDADYEKLFKNIVKYNNSQNPITDRAFVASQSEFRRLQNDFEDKGHLLINVRQSDVESFKEKYRQRSAVVSLSGRNFALRQKFGFASSNTLRDFYIPLDRLLQAILAFAESGQYAYLHKKDLYKVDSDAYHMVQEFIRNVTTDTLLALYYLYARAERAKKENEDSGMRVVPWYLIDCFARYDCNNRRSREILEKLNNSDQINDIIRRYSWMTATYADRYVRENNTDYTKMIKQPIDNDLMDELKRQASMFSSL